MKRSLFILVLLLVMLSVTVAATQIRISRLEVVNKSGDILKVKLVGKEYGKTHYFELPEGSRAFPSSGTWDLWFDTYTVFVWYASEVSDAGIIEELTACTTGIDLDLDDYSFYRLKADKANIRFTVTPCGVALPNAGSPGDRMYKWTYWVPDRYHLMPYPR